MPSNSTDPHQVLTPGVVDQRDSKQITDLIEQLDRDLEETQKNSRKPE